MKAYWKIPKEWVQEWGLNWIEAGVLSDILSYPECTVRERASRCGVSIGKISACIATYNKKQICSKIEHASVHILNKLCSNSEQKRSKNEQIKKEKKEIPPTPPIKNKKKNIEDQEENLPTASVGGEKKSPKRENKYTPEQQKFHGELRDIFLEEWKRYNGDDFAWSGAAMSNTIKIIGQIRFKMEKEGLDEITNDKLKDNFRIFIQQMFKNLPWYRQNGTPQIIYSKFNEIYIQLKNGKPKQQQQAGPTDEYLRRVAAEVAANGGLAF